MGAVRSMSVSFKMRGGLPFVNVDLTVRGQIYRFDNILLDTGSAGTLFDADELSDIGIKHEGSDVIATLSGIGGAKESVLLKQVERLAVGELVADDLTIEVGNLSNYGFGVRGIVGADFLAITRAILDFDLLTLRAAL